MRNTPKYFKEPKSSRQKQYEAVRAFVIDKLPAEIIAQNFGYKVSTIYELVKRAKTGKVVLFPDVPRGPQKRRTSEEISEKICQLRKQSCSVVDIHTSLTDEGIIISQRTIERILYEAGFKRLKRRTNKELGITKKGEIIPERSENLNFNKLEPFNVDIPIAGICFFIPYIIESGVLDIVKECKLPESNSIGSVQAALSMLFLKLIGSKRLCEISQYDHEPGFGVLAGVNRLPKDVYMNTYSCLTSESMLIDFQERIIKRFREVYPQFYNSKFINLDFHSIPHYGDDSEMEKIWCGARNKTLKGANTIFVQDSQSNTILYTRADILRKEESQEIKKFIRYWKKITSKLDETLVFDCKFTTYQVLDEITNDSIKFITLRRRSKNLINSVSNIPKEKWQKIQLDIPKRKYNKVSVHESHIKLPQCSNMFRQIIIKDHGRANPTFIITNNEDLSILRILEVYAKRWRVENKISELVSFFNLNALSSPLMIRIHFEILWTMIADTLYRIFANDLRRFEDNLAPTVFKKFINMPGRVIFDGERFLIKIRKRAHSPILKGVEKINAPFRVPWLNNLTVEIIWTP
jgi:transposase